MLSLKSALVVSAATCVAAGGGVGVGQLIFDGRLNVAHQSRIEPVEPSLVERLPVLGRRATPEDRIPQAVLNSRILNDGLLDTSTSRRIAHGEWLALSRQRSMVCMVAVAEVDCGRVTALLRRGAAPGVAWRAGEGATVAGVALSSVRNVVIHLVRRDIRVPVRGGVFFQRLSVVPSAVTWRGPSHELETLALPRQVAGKPVAGGGPPQ